jgi:hypothetical protein
MGRNFKLLSNNKLPSDGLCCPIKEEITINPDCANIPRSIIHESVHAIFFSGGIFEAIDNEKLIDVICEQVARVLDENFELKWKKKQ